MTFNDPVHGTIEVHPLCLKIIDTPEFQRLRNLRQCGICYLVYPSAIHTRFEHSIGVYHLAGLLLEQLKRRNTPITPEEDLCVRIAALCHDLGHGPFSHLWEEFVRRQNGGKKWRHEAMSVILFERLIENNNLDGEFKKYNLQESHKNKIKNIISGNYKSIEKEKLFLFEIVANKKTNIDVDRWDYMLRDAKFFGVECPINYQRLMPHLRVEKVPETGEHRIAFRDKLKEDIWEIFRYRMKLHRICYKHRVCKKIEIMLLDALIAADDCFFGNGMKLSNCQEKDIQTYLALNDGLMNSILYSTNNNMSKAQSILERITRRQLYPQLFTIVLPSTMVKEAVKTLESELHDIEAQVQHKFGIEIRLGLIDINMGIEGDDPFSEVIFFKKDDVPRPFVEDHKNKRQLSLLGFSVDAVSNEEIKEEIKKEVVGKIRSYLPA